MKTHTKIANRNKSHAWRLSSFNESSPSVTPLVNNQWLFSVSVNEMPFIFSPHVIVTNIKKPILSSSFFALTNKVLHNYSSPPFKTSPFPSSLERHNNCLGPTKSVFVCVYPPYIHTYMFIQEEECQ